MQYQTQEDYDSLLLMLSSPKHLWGILLQSCMTLWCYWCMQSWFWWWILIWMAHQASVKTRALVNPIWIWWTSKKNVQCNWDPWGTTHTVDPVPIVTIPWLLPLCQIGQQPVIAGGTVYYGWMFASVTVYFGTAIASASILYMDVYHASGQPSEYPSIASQESVRYTWLG